MTAVQEIRDLVRYTLISVELNGKSITRDPRTEKWDAEDEFAYYRAKEDGAVAIYNQGVLVRNDPSHMWGCGGLIVSKKAIGLNVSRTEILRKTCSTWKAIAKHFATLAEAISSRLGEHRKTEARREKSARALLSGEQNIFDIYQREEVITVLPGKRHLTLYDFLRFGDYHYNRSCSVVENGFDVPKAEAMARAKVTAFIHPKTLERFGCYNVLDFQECLVRINENIMKANTNNRLTRYLYTPALLDFKTLSSAFIERTEIVDEKKHLDKETRRAWVALRWCLENYAALCTGGHQYNQGQVSTRQGGKKLTLLLGKSNAAEAWTDGETYIAIDMNAVSKIKTHPLKTVSYLFSVIEHELAHEGDSLDCGHDEAFYQRYHDISLRFSEERQRYIHIWLMKYTTSMERDGKRAAGDAWRERYLLDRAGSGRVKKGLTPVIEDIRNDPVLNEDTPPQNMAFIQEINNKLIASGQCPPPADWDAVGNKAKEIAEQRMKVQKNKTAEIERRTEIENEEFEAYLQSRRKYFSKLLNTSGDELSDTCIIQFLDGESDDDVLILWKEKPWEEDFYDEEYDYYSEVSEEIISSLISDQREEEDSLLEKQSSDVKFFIDESLHHLINQGETKWTLDRNAAAAGFYRIEDYLVWRSEQ